MFHPQHAPHICHRLPYSLGCRESMPTRLCWKPGMTCTPCTGRAGICRLQGNEEVYHVPDAVPTLMGGTAEFISDSGASGI